MCESLDEFTWLYRGVPEESPEVEDVEANEEVYPPRPDRKGERWRQLHLAGDTETGYTSWTTDRSLAVAAAEFASEAGNLSGRLVIFRIRIAELDVDRVFEGRADEDEFLIEGTVEQVVATTNEDDSDDE